MNEIPSPKPSHKKTYCAVGGVFVLVLFCICLFAGAFVWADPFQWGIVGSVKMLLGLGGNPAISAMPENTPVYVGVNLLNAQSDKLQRVIQPFVDALNTSTGNTGTAMQDLDKQMKETLGVTITDDIIPWIGKYAGLGLTKPIQNGYSSPSDVGLVLALQSRNNKKADAFLTKLKDYTESQMNETYRDTQYHNIHIYYIDPGYSGGTGVAFCRSGDVVLFSLNEADLETAIDTQKGSSLGNNQSFKALQNQLPSDSLVSIYINPQQFEALYSTLMQSYGYLGISGDQLDSFMTQSMDKLNGVILSMSVVDAGLQWDLIASYNPDKLTALDKSNLSNNAAGFHSAPMLPQNTLFYIGTRISNETWKNIRQQVITTFGLTASEYDEAMTSLENEVGLNPEKDIYPYLGGDIFVAVVPSTKSSLMQQSNLNLGIVAAFETVDSNAMLSSVDKFATAVQQTGGVPLDHNKGTNLTYYVQVDSYSNLDTIAFGMGKKYLVAGTSRDLLEDLFNGGSSLAQNSQYQSALKDLPNGINPVFYIDLAGTLANIRAAVPSDSIADFDESLKFLHPIQAIVAGSSSLHGNIIRTTVVIMVTQAK